MNGKFYLENLGNSKTFGKFVVIKYKTQQGVILCKQNIAWNEMVNNERQDTLNISLYHLTNSCTKDFKEEIIIIR